MPAHLAAALPRLSQEINDYFGTEYDMDAPWARVFPDAELELAQRDLEIRQFMEAKAAGGGGTLGGVLQVPLKEEEEAAGEEEEKEKAGRGARRQRDGPVNIMNMDLGSDSDADSDFRASGSGEPPGGLFG